MQQRAFTYFAERSKKCELIDENLNFMNKINDLRKATGLTNGVTNCSAECIASGEC